MDVTNGFADKLPAIITQFQADLQVDEGQAIATVTAALTQAHTMEADLIAGADTISKARVDQAFDRLEKFREGFFADLDSRLATGFLLKAAPKI